MTKINYKSDFDFILNLVDCEGNDVGFPQYDFTGRLYTASDNVFLFSSVGGELTNCYNDNGLIHIVCDNHGLYSGVLRCEFVAELPNDIYPDGYRRLVTPKPIDIELVRGAGDCDADINAETILPYIKGEKGDKGDKGEQGDKGDKGDKGDSAYTQAVEYGYDGTEEEFAELLNSITAKQNALLSSPTIIVNDDNTLTATDAVAKALFIKMWDARCIVWTDANKKDVRGKYNPETDKFELNKLELTYEEAIDVFTHPIIYNDNMYNFVNTKQRTHLPPYSTKSNFTYSINASTFHGTRMESIALPGCVASGYWDNGDGTLKYLSLTGIRDARVLQYKKNLEQFRWEWAGNIGTSVRPRISLYVNESPKLDYESYRQLIDGQWDGTNVISLKVCAEAYAKIIGDTSVPAVAALSEEEAAKWQSLLAKAEAKNVVITK